MFSIEMPQLRTLYCDCVTSDLLLAVIRYLINEKRLLNVSSNCNKRLKEIINNFSTDKRNKLRAKFKTEQNDRCNMLLKDSER